MREFSLAATLLGGFGAIVSSAPVSAQCLIEETDALLAAVGEDGAQFGYAMASDGTRLVIGSPPGFQSLAIGSVHVLNRTGDGWTEEARLVPSDGVPGYLFGDSVDIDADVLVVGATGASDFGQRSGAAYVFRRDATGWIEEARLTRPAGAALDCFAYDVELEGDVIVASCGACDLPGVTNAGLVYVFRYDRGTGEWALETELGLPDPTQHDRFGSAIDLEGNRLIVTGAGVITVYENDRETGAWNAVGTAVPTTRPAAVFGRRVALQGDLIVAGIHAPPPSTPGPGLVYVFRRDPGRGSWIQEALLEPEGPDAVYMEWAVAVDGDLIAAGAPGPIYDDPPGSVFLFRRDGSCWHGGRVQLVPSDGEPLDQFGFSLLVMGDEILVGDRRDSNANGAAAGAVRCFTDVDAAFDACLAMCPGDSNGDGVVNVDDLVSVILDWGTDGSANGGDLVGPEPRGPPDCIVDTNDLNEVIIGWGVCP